jgi:hypothetical protein
MPVHESPNTALWRTGITAVESVGGLPGDLNSGLNFSGYDVAMFTVYPSGGALPTIEVMVWDTVTEAWISAAPKAEYAANAADEPFTFTVPAHGRGFYARVSVLAAGSVDIGAMGRANGSF